MKMDISPQLDKPSFCFRIVSASAYNDIQVSSETDIFVIILLLLLLPSSFLLFTRIVSASAYKDIPVSSETDIFVSGSQH